MKKALFIDRDGTLVIEPPVDYQLDSFHKLEFYPKVFRNLGFIRSKLDFEFVMVTNQDGLGTSSFPEDTFWPVHNLVLKTLEGEGIIFDDILIDRSFPEDHVSTRKPGTGMMGKYLTGDYDLANSFVIEYLQENGYGNIAILEGSWVGDKTEESFEVCGYRMLSEQYGVPLIDAQKEKSMPVQCGDMELQICECAKKVDFMINVPVMKGHCQTKITCALKNMKGLLPNKEKRHFHAMGLHRPIAHLGLGIHQDFILVDNICGDLDFEDGGNPFIMNRLFAGLDPVLIDAYVCEELHYKPEDVPYVKMAEELGVGSADLTRLSIRQIGEIGEKRVIPEKRKIVELQDAVEEVESCSACYGYLIPALDRLREEGLLPELHEKICIGQGYRGKSGALGVGSCTSGFACNLKGCPPTDEQMYEFLKQYIATRRKTEAEK